MPPIAKYLESITNRLVLINVVLFLFVQSAYPNSYSGLELFSWNTNRFEVWQLLTHMFMHASVPHLAFNMIALWSFGRVLEHVWGKQRFLIYYLVCGVGAAIISQVVSPSLGAMVGASGAIYGVLVAFAWLFPNFKVMLIFLPVPIAAKYFIPVLLLIDLSAGVTGVSIFGQNIAHFAHVGGAVVGFLLLQFWLIPSTRR
jgi:membrane associated rhomboid family serine protease